MNTTPDAREESVTLLEWLDAFARGTTPLPTNHKIAKVGRFLSLLGTILAWIFTLTMLTALTFGTFITSICLAYQSFLVGWIFWQAVMVLITVLGTLAFVSAGRFLESAIFLFVSPLVNSGYFAAELGLATVEPLLVIPLHVALNGAYLLVVWWFLLRRKRVMDYLVQPAADG